MPRPDTSTLPGGLQAARRGSRHVGRVALSIQPRGGQFQRACLDDLSGGIDLGKQSSHIDAPMDRRIRAEPSCGLPELTAAAVRVPTARLIPGYCDMHEPLQEVLLLGVCRTPGELELLVCLEVLTSPDQLQATFVALVRPDRGQPTRGRG